MSEAVTIRGATIRLGQLLKLAGIVDNGSEVKALLAAAPALVNGEAETRRGRQLHDGDHVRVGDRELRVLAADASTAPSGLPYDRSGDVGDDHGGGRGGGRSPERL